MPHRTFTLAEVADYLHLAVAEVAQLVRHGEIPFSRRGTQVVFQRREIDAWASQRILGLPARRLACFHEASRRQPRPSLAHDALLPALLRPEGIELALPAKTRASVIREMVAFAERTGRVFDSSELLASVQEREALCSTALPGGLAVLHARNHDAYRFDESFLLVGRTVQAVPFGAPDGFPTRIFLLLCLQDEGLHLHTLARLCLLVHKTNLVAHLLAAPDPDSAYTAFIAAEEVGVLAAG